MINLCHARPWAAPFVVLPLTMHLLLSFCRHVLERSCFLPASCVKAAVLKEASVAWASECLCASLILTVTVSTCIDCQQNEGCRQGIVISRTLEVVGILHLDKGRHHALEGLPSHLQSLKPSLTQLPPFITSLLLRFRLIGTATKASEHALGNIHCLHDLQCHDLQWIHDSTLKSNVFT